MKTKTLQAQRVGIISDLHLAPGAMSRCTATDAELCQLLRQMRESCDLIVVAGDIFDLSRPKFPLIGWRAHLEEIRLTHPKVVGALERHHWVFGNHDRWLTELGVPERIDVTWGSAHLRIQHGHQFDVPMKQIRSLEAAGNFAAGWLVRANLGSWAKRMADVPVGVDQLQKKLLGSNQPKRDRSADGALHLLHDADVVAMGHSHRLRLVPTSSGLFANTGSICRGHIDWVQVDLESRVARIVRDGDVLGEEGF